MAKPIAERGNAPFSKTPEASKASFCLGLSNCRSDGGLSFGARWAHTEVCNHWAPKLKRRINGDFTGQAGVGKIDNVNFSEGGKTPFLKNTAQNCPAILLTNSAPAERCSVLVCRASLPLFAWRPISLFLCPQIALLYTRHSRRPPLPQARRDF